MGYQKYFKNPEKIDLMSVRERYCLGDHHQQSFYLSYKRQSFYTLITKENERYYKVTIKYKCKDYKF